jgi:hypothetical protein
MFNSPSPARKGRDSSPMPGTHPVTREPVFCVPLASGGSALVDPDDYHRLMRLGVSHRWTFNNGVVSAKLIGWHEQTLFPVARAVMMAGFREMVRYRNHNQLDLTRSNLVLLEGVRTNAKSKVVNELQRREAALPEELDKRAQEEGRQATLLEAQQMAERVAGKLAGDSKQHGRRRGAL